MFKDLKNARLVLSVRIMLILFIITGTGMLITGTLHGPLLLYGMLFGSFITLMANLLFGKWAE